MSDTASSWAAARRFLCVRLDGMGDLLMTTPAMRALKQKPGGAHITVLCSRAGAALAAQVPEIDDAIIYEAPWMKSAGQGAGVAEESDSQMLDTLRQGRFDAGVIFTVYSQNPLPAALLLWQARIPLRLAHCRENPYQLLSDWVHEQEPQHLIRHEVRRQLDLVAEVGFTTRHEHLSFQPSAADEAWTDQALERLDLDVRQRWIMLHPGATAASRRYPPDLWLEVVSGLARTLGRPIVLVGGPEDANLLEQMQQAAPGFCRRLRSALTLGQLGALIGRAAVLVCNNSGPAHLAAAMGTPVVDLYALTNPQHTPWQVASRVLFQRVPCQFCYRSVCPQGHHQCLRGVEPSRVVEAAADLLFAREHYPLPQETAALTLGAV